jgi:hypothetical protein
LSSAYASGSKAFGFCDRCGFRSRLSSLKGEFVNLESTGLLVCDECWDRDHPQNMLGRDPVDDPQALRNPRPDTSQDASRWGTGVAWNFETSVEDWRADQVSASFDGSVVWRDGQYVDFAVITDGATGFDYYKKGTAGQFASIDVDSALASGRPLNIVRITLRKPDDDTGDPFPWLGEFRWGKTDNPDDSDPFSDNYSVSLPEPDWDKSMGDKWVTLEYDMLGNADWSGVVTSLRFMFNDMDGGALSSRTLYYINSVRVEEN